MVNVLVVGAGPTGLAMGLLALRAGLSVRVVDKASGPSRFSKAIGLQYRVSEILAYLGLADRFLAAGATPGRVRMYAGRRVLLSLAFLDFSSLAGRGAFAPSAIMLPQSRTERLLGEALEERGGRLEWDTEFEGLSQSGAGVTALLRRADGSREQAEADWLIGCDGAHSVVRKILGFDFEGKSSPLSFVIADVESTWPSDRECVHVWFHRDGSVAAMPLPGPRQWRLFVETTRRPEMAKPGLDTIRDLISERTGLADIDLDHCLWQSEFSIHCRMVDRLHAGRVFLAGDAAHIHSPTGGQGIATGLQDVANLAWKLGQVQRRAPIELLDSYSAERLPEVRRVLDETDRNTNVFVAPTSALRALRDYIVLPMLRSRAVQRRLVRRLSQLDVTYRASALSQHIDERRWRGGTRVRAGDRAPDVLFAANSDDRDTNLFSMLRHGCPVALIGLNPNWDVTSAALATALQQLDVVTRAVTNVDLAEGDLPCPTMRDQFGDMARLYGMENQYLCVIRPDGHVGLFQRPIRLRPIRNWLACIYPRNLVDAVFSKIGNVE